MKSIFRIFFKADGTQPSFVLLCLVLAGLAEAVGLSTMLPAITQMTGGVQDSSSSFNQDITDLLTFVGIPTTLPSMIILIIAVLCLKAVLMFVALSYVGYSVASVATRMRTQLIKHLLNVRWSYFSTQRVGRIANAISNDATRAGQAYLSAAKCIAYLVQVSFYVAIALKISPILATVGLGAGALMAGSMSLLTHVSKRAGYRMADRTSELIIYLSDALNNIKPLKTMERREPFADMLMKRVRSVRKAMRTQIMARLTVVYGEEIIIFVCLGAGLYGAAVIWSVPVPELIVMALLFYNVVYNIGKVQQFLQSAMEFEGSYWRLKGLIDESAAQREENAGTKGVTFDEGCRFDAVSFSHDTDPVVADVSFDIPVGGITVLQGPSGAGKTTLIDLLTGLYQPDSGRILVDGTPLSEIDLARWRDMIGYVPQELNCSTIRFCKMSPSAMTQ